MLEALRTHATLWLLRVAWLTLPWSVGAAAADALGACSSSTARVASAQLWVAWAVVLTATLVRRPWALTLTRVAAPASLATAVAAVVAADAWGADLSPGLAAAAVGAAVVTVALALLPETGNAFVDGLSYGDERRMLLRVPFWLELVLVPLVWAVVAAGVAVPSLLWLQQWWGWATAASIVCAAASGLGFRSLLQLTRRWAVFVPNGIVIHDYLATTEAFLLRSAHLRSLAPAPASVDLDADDLVDVSAGARGPVLLAEVVPAVEVMPRHAATAQAQAASRILFCPTRPGEFLAEAARRGFS